MENVLGLIDKLVKEYGYQPIPPMFADTYHNTYLKALPEWATLEGNQMELCDLSGVPVCNGYTRIVIGDYGAFIEFTEAQAAGNFITAPGQEYRTEERYSHVKYLWLTTRNGSHPKLYLQKHTVPYADYKVGMYYVSPYDVIPSGN